MLTQGEVKRALGSIERSKKIELLTSHQKRLVEVITEF